MIGDRTRAAGVVSFSILGSLSRERGRGNVYMGTCHGWDFHRISRLRIVMEMKDKIMDGKEF